VLQVWQLSAVGLKVWQLVIAILTLEEQALLARKKVDEHAVQVVVATDPEYVVQLAIGTTGLQRTELAKKYPCEHPVHVVRLE